MRPRTSLSMRGQACSLCDIIHLGYFHQIRLLISKGIDIESRDSSRRTPLILCAFMAPEEWGVNTAMTLIENNVCVGARDCYGRNVLHYACIYERQNLVPVLLRAIDFDLNQMDTLGNTALHYAAISGNLTITRLLAESFKKYRLDANKVNHQGRTATVEASLAGHTACAQIIDLELTPGCHGSDVKDVRFAEDVALSSKSSFIKLKKVSTATENEILRPLSAACAARCPSSASMNFASEGRAPSSLRSRSSASLRMNGCYRKSQNPLPAKVHRRDEDIIDCAPISDFRNKPDYVCKLVNLPYDPEFWDQMSMLDSANRNRSSWVESCTTGKVPGTGWRQELEQLFQVYEHQCSPSWRTSKKWEKPTLSQTSSPGPEEEDKSKKGKSHNSLSRTVHGKDSSPEPRRRVSSFRVRKMPNGKFSSTTSIDGSLDTSSESINSLASSRRRVLERETGLGRPESLASRQRLPSARDANFRAQSRTASPSPSTGPTSSFTHESLLVDNAESQIKNIKKNSLLTTKTDIKKDITPTSSHPTLTGTSGIPPQTQKLTAAAEQKLKASADQKLTAAPEQKLTAAPEQKLKAAPEQKLTAAPEKKLTAAAEELLPSANNHEEPMLSSSPPTNKVATMVPKILLVKDTHITEERRDSSSSLQQQVDTSKLWVQNPYESNSEDTEDNDDENY